MNQENKKQVIIAGALGVVLVVVLAYQFLIAGGPAPPPKPASSATASTQPAHAGGDAKGAKSAKPEGKAGEKVAAAEGPARLKKVDVDLDALIESLNVVTFVYDNERISRNPMTPLVGRIIAPTEQAADGTSIINEGTIRNKSVSGIIYNEFNPVAIIDDEVIAEGHQYPDGVVVTQIEPKRVWFQWRDSLIPVELKEL